MIDVPINVPKAFVYLTRLGRDLLVTSLPDHPEAGLQVPAGTIHEGETPEHAAARELTEETGLVSFGTMTWLGERTYDMRPFGKPEVHHRFFYHAIHHGDGPDRWPHVETHAGLAPIRLDLTWWALPDGLPPLVADHGALLGEVLALLRSGP